MSHSLSMSPKAGVAVAHLMRGVIYSDRKEDTWNDVVTHQGAIRDYLRLIGLELYLDESEGFAFLRQESRTEEEPDETDSRPPRLVARRQLNFSLSVLCVVLRKKLLEADAAGGATKVVVDFEELVETGRVYLPTAKNEAKVVEQIRANINKLCEYGFLRPLSGSEHSYEIRRVLKAMFDAQWLSELDAKLEEYALHGSNSD